MQLIRKIAFVLATCFVFLGSTGFYVFVHSCKMDGREQSLYFKSEHQCEEEVQTESCCHQPAEEKSKDCCQDEVKIVQVNYDYFHSTESPEFVPFHLPTAPGWSSVLSESIECEALLSSIQNTGPPPEGGRELIIRNQQFRC